ncbi:uncharacterized protein RJT20DRAFT_124849 [Scheffersomyces xylosifermentans]|uniref:uncharacterized protein n=1 Tax=Scheffersomyces xylosifermentans TaxID=1304137 RepID=UPI00315D4F80
MPKDQLLKLSLPEYKHLLNIPYRVVEEQDMFCLNVIELVNEMIIEDPSKAAQMIQCIKDETMRELVLATLSKAFEKDSIKRSILDFIINPTSKVFRLGFFRNLTNILHLKGGSTEQKSSLLLNYLRLLALTNTVNPEPLLLTTEVYAKIMHNTPSAKFSELYSYFFHINIQTNLLETIKVLKKTLSRGSQKEKFILRTGWINPKWHDLLETSFSESHQRKMINFFSVDDLREFTERAVKTKDVPSASLYLNLLVAKFEHKCSTASSHRQADDSEVFVDVQTVVRVIVGYLMVFKGPKSCLQVLRYCVKNQLDVEFSLLITIMRNLRLSGHYQESLLLMNNIPLQNLSEEDRMSLVEEVLMLIKSRYPASPKILIGYTSAIFNGSTEGENEGLNLLNKLHLLELSHGSGEMGEISSFDSIQRATVDQRLTGFHFTSNTLANVYETLLDSFHRRDLTPTFMNSLYERYIGVVMDSLKSQDLITPFTAEAMNDRVINNLISYLLRSRPGGKANFSIDHSKERFDVAKRIFTDFTEKVRLSRRNITISLMDLLIHTSLEVHGDYQFASKVIRYSRDNHVPFTFNQVYPFIIYHYKRKEFKTAELWYKQLVNSGAKTIAPSAKSLFKIARELNWDVNGFVYRKKNIHRNYKAKEELLKIQSDPAIFIRDRETEEVVTDELIDGDEPQANSSNVNFSDELSALMYASTSKQ